MKLKVCHDHFLPAHPRAHGLQETKIVTNLGGYTENGEN